MSENNRVISDENIEEHHHSHHSGEHSGHHHSHHSGGHSGRRHGSGSRFGLKQKRFANFSSQQRLSKIAASSKSAEITNYNKISRRVIFGLVILSIIAFFIYQMTVSDSDQSLKNASYVPSEMSSLKRRVMSLEQQVEALEAELAQYKAAFGELPESSEN